MKKHKLLVPYKKGPFVKKLPQDENNLRGVACITTLKELLADGCNNLTKRQLAERLNKLGYRTAKDLPWTMRRLSVFLSRNNL